MTARSARHDTADPMNQTAQARMITSSSVVTSLVVRAAGVVPARLDLAHVGTADQQLGLSLGTVLVYLRTRITARAVADGWSDAAVLARSLGPAVTGRRPLVIGPSTVAAMVRLAGVPRVTATATPRGRGNIRRMRDRVQVRVSAGEDPSTGERIILVDSVMIEVPGNPRSERVALKEAEKLRTKLLAAADALKVARTRATVGALLERWMAQHEIDPTTRMTYESQIRMYIVAAVGDVPLVLFVRDASQRLETPLQPAAEMPGAVFCRRHRSRRCACRSGR